MASASFSLTRGTLQDKLSGGAQTVTEGTLVPGAGDLEVRIDLTKNFTKKEVKNAFDVIWRYIQNPNSSTTLPI